MSSPSNSSNRPPYIRFSRLSPPANGPKRQSKDHRPGVSSPSFGTNAYLTTSIDDADAALPKKATCKERTTRLDRLDNAADNLSEKVAMDNESTYSSETLVDSNPSSSHSGPSGNEAWNPSDTSYPSRLREDRRSRRVSRWLLRCTATAMWLAPVVTPGLAVVIMAIPTVIGTWVIMLTS